MAEPTNEDRAGIAESVLHEYVRAKESGMDLEDYGIEEAIVDLISDLLHLAHAEGMKPEKLVQSATMHFEAELDGDEEDEG
jgi:hypothetical protein